MSAASSSPFDPWRGPSPSTTTPIAVVGFGYWGSKHARVLAGIPGVDLTVVDTNPERLAQVRAAFPFARTAERLEDVADSLRGVVIATPPSTHAAVALQAIKSGLHVFVEKPLATTIADCESMIDAALAADRVLMVGHTFEHNASVWKLRELIRSGELGELRYIDSARLNLGLYQPDVNVIWDLATHDISIINFLFGRAPDCVRAWGHGHVSAHQEDVGYVQLGYDDGLIAYIHVSWLDPQKVRRLTIVGSKKMAVYNDLSVSEPIRVYDVGVEYPSPDESMEALPLTYRYGDIVSPYFAVREPLLVQDSHFVDCIRTGCHPTVDGFSGLATVRVLSAVDEALRSGAEVRLDSAAPTAEGKWSAPAPDTRLMSNGFPLRAARSHG